jgi:hypothetical protein
VWGDQQHTNRGHPFLFIGRPPDEPSGLSSLF